MVENSIEKNIDHEVFTSLEDIKDTLKNPPNAENTTVHIHSDHVSYDMTLVAFRYLEGFEPTWGEIGEYCEGWHQITPLRIALLQGCKASEFIKQTDLILNKILKETDFEERREGIFSILRPEENKYGVLLVFHPQ